MPSHDLETMEETFLDQQELLVHNKQTAQEKIKTKRRLLKTVALSMAFFCLGLCVAIPGPTLLDLGRRVNRDTEHMTFIFTARSVGFLIGSLVGGVLFDFFDQQILLFYTLAVVAVATTGIPWCRVLLTLSSLICLQGVAIGVLDTGGNVFCIKIWGKRSAPFMQILHFAFGIGAFLAPLIARPFLMDTNVSVNATVRGYHPVVSIMSRSAHNMFIRDVSNMPFMDEGYAFNENPLNVARVNSKTRVQVLKNFTEQSQISTLNSVIELTSTTPSVITIRPVKPGVIIGDNRKVIYADDSEIDGKIKDLKNKVSQEEEKMKVATTTVDHSVNMKIPSWHENHFFNEKSRWKKKRDKKYRSNIIIFSVKNMNSTVYETGSGINIYENGKSINVYETRTSLTSVIESPKKPGSYNSESLSQDRDDAQSVDSELKDLKIYEQQSNPEKDETTPEVTTGGDIPLKHRNAFFTVKNHLMKKLANSKADEEEWNGLVDGHIQNQNINKSDNVVDIDETEQNMILTSIPSAIVEKNIKPGFHEGEDLSQDHAEDVSIDSKLGDLKSDLDMDETTADVSITDVVVSKHDTDDTADVGDLNSVTIVRVKRQSSKVNETNNSKNLANDNQLPDNKIGSNLTSTTPSVITIRPVKPGVISGDNRKGIYADASEIDAKIKDLKNKLSHSKEEEDKMKVVTTTVDHSVNMTTELADSENGTNSTIDWNTTGHDSLVPNISRTAEKATVLTSTTSSPTTTTAVLTTTPTTIITTVLKTTPTTIITTVLTTTPTTIPMATTRITPAAPAPSTEPTTAQETVITNTSSITKPTITGDLIQDLVTSLAGMSRIQIAYPVIGLLLAVNSGFFLFLHCKDRMVKSPLHIRRYQDPTRNPYTKCFVSSVVLLLFLFFLAYMGMEVTFGGLLATFAVYYPTDPWSPAQGASLTSLFWGCLAIGRGFSIFISRCFKPSSMIVINLSLIVLGALILSFGVPAHPAALWVGTVTLGLGMSSLFPTAILWANSCYPLSGSATAVFVAGCGVGEMSVPLLTGYLYENFTHMAVMYVILFLSCLLSMLYISIQMLVYRKGKMSQLRSNSGFARLKNMEEVEEESDMGVVEGINLGIMETTWRRRVQGEEEKRGEVGGKQIMEFTKLMEM